MILKAISTGSIGNCYLLQADNGETLILDCGVPIKDIQRGLNWDITHVVGCVASHIHGDHSKSIKDLRNLGIKIFTPYEDLERVQADSNVMLVEKMGGFDIMAFQVPHNGTRNCGFLIRVDGQKILYLTDLEYCPYSFKNQHINHYRVVEFDKYAIASYNAVHGTDFPTMDITKVHAEDLNICDTETFTYLLTLFRVRTCLLLESKLVCLRVQCKVVIRSQKFLKQNSWDLWITAQASISQTQYMTKMHFVPTLQRLRVAVRNRLKCAKVR